MYRKQSEMKERIYFIHSICFQTVFSSSSSSRFPFVFTWKEQSTWSFIHVCACMPPLSGEKAETHLPSTVKGMFNSCHFSAAAAAAAASVVAVESLTWIINRVGEIHTAVMVVLVVVMKDAKGDILQSIFFRRILQQNP